MPLFAIVCSVGLLFMSLSFTGHRKQETGNVGYPPLAMRRRRKSPLETGVMKESQGMRSRLKSRKFWIGVITPAVIIIARVLGLELDEKTTLAIAGVASTYILGEAYVDSRKIKD